MGGARYVPIIFTADGATALNVVKQMKNAFEDMDASAEKTSRGGMQNAFLTADLLSRGLAFLGREVLELARDFKAFVNDSVLLARELEYSVAQSLSIKPELDTSQVRRELSDMQRRIPQTSKQLADSLYDTFSSINVTQQEGLQLTEKFARGATAAITDTKTFGTAVIGVMNAYKKEVADVDHIQDVFFNTVAGGVVSGQELAANLGVVTQAAKNMGVDFDNLGGLIAGVTKEGGSAAQNINNLANTLMKLPTKEVQKELNDMGVKTRNAKLEFLPILEVLDQLKEKLDRMPPALRAAKLQEILPDAQARTGLQTLLSQLEFVHDQVDLNSTAMGSASKAYETMANTAETAALLQENAIRSLQESIGDLVITNDVLIRSNQLVTEQINGYTDATRQAGSETQQFVEDVVDTYADLKAQTIPFLGFMTKTIQGFAKTLLLIVTAITYAIAKTIETAVQLSFQGVTSLLNLAIDGLNKVQGIAAKMGPVLRSAPGGGLLAAIQDMGQIPRIPDIPNFLGSDKLRANLGNVFGELKYIVKSMDDFAAEGARAKVALEEARRQRERRRTDQSGWQQIPDVDRTAQSSALADELRARNAMTGTEMGGAAGQGKKLSRDEYIDQLIKSNASRFGVDPDLIRAVIGQESSGRGGAVSNKGAQGLMQLMPGTAKRFGVNNPFDPAQNIRGGTAYLAFLTDLFKGDLKLALAGYNAGEGAVQKYGGIPPYRETKAYVPAVLERMGKLKDGATMIKVGGETVKITENQVDEILARLRSPLLSSPAGTSLGQLSPFPLTPEEQYRKDQRDEVYGSGGQLELLALRERNFEAEKASAGLVEWIALRHQEHDQTLELVKIEERLRFFRNQNADSQFVEQRRLLLAKGEQLQLEEDIQRVQDEIANGPYNQSLRIQLALVQDIAGIRQRDERAIIDSNRAQLELSEKSIYSATQANARVLEFLAQQKGVTDIVADARIGIMEQSFNGIDSLLDRIIPKMHGFGSVLKQIAADLLKLAASREFAKLLGLGTGASTGASFGSDGGGGFSFGSLFNSGNGITGTIRNLFGFGRTAGPGAAAATSTSPVMAGLNPFAGPAVGAAFGLGGGATAGGAAAMAALNPFAGPSAIAATGGAGSGGMFAGLMPLLSNPITWIAAGAAVGGFLLWKHFRNGTEKKLREAIQGAYGISVKDMQVLKQVKELGEQAFGKGQVSKRISETIALDQVKELLAGYAESTGQKSNLVTQKQLTDPNFAGNRLIAREFGGEVRKGVPYIVGERRPELFIPDESGYILPSVPEPPRPAGPRVPSSSTSGGGSPQSSNSSGGGGVPPAMVAAHIAALNANTESNKMLLRRVTSMPPGALVAQGINENPNSVVDGLEASTNGSYKVDTLKRKFGPGGTL